MSQVRVSPVDLGRLLTAAAQARVEMIACAVDGEVLTVDIAGARTGLPLLRRLDATFRIRGTLESPGRLALHVELARMTGGLALLLRPFLRQILEALLQSTGQPAIRIETAQRIVIDLADLRLAGGRRLGEFSQIEAVRLPGRGGCALECDLRLPPNFPSAASLI